MKQVILVRTPHLPDVKYRGESNGVALAHALRLAWLHHCRIDAVGDQYIVEAAEYYAQPGEQP